MTITIGFGWWIAPAVVTIVAFALAWRAQSPHTGGDYNFVGFFNTMAYIVALVPSLAAWLIWSLFR